MFSLASIKASIQAAVDEAAAQPEPERKRQIRALQLRWHPGALAAWRGEPLGRGCHSLLTLLVLLADKNPVMKEWCGEVTKLLNSAVAALGS